MWAKCLVHEQVIRFPGLKHGGFLQIGTRKSENVATAKLPQDFSAGLFGKQVGRLGNLIANLSIEIGLPNSIQYGNGDGSTGFMSLKHDGENLLLKLITELAREGSCYLGVHVMGFGEVDGTESAKEGVRRMDWKSYYMELNSRQPVLVDFTGRPTISRSYESVKQIENIPDIIINSWRDRKTFQGTFSVFLAFSKGVFRKVDYCPDLELMTSENGVSVKCHRGVLSHRNPELARVLEIDNGSSTLTIMNYLSKACIQAFFKYIYNEDATSVVANTDMAVEVLRAALEFKVDGLIRNIQEYLCGKDNEEIGVDGVLKLFRIVKSSLYETSCEDSDSDSSSEESDSSSKESDSSSEESDSSSKESDSSSKESDSSSEESDSSSKESDSSSEEIDSYSKKSDSSDSSLDLEDQIMEEDGLGVNCDGLRADMKENVCRKLLKQKAEEMIRWYLKNQPSAVLQSNEYKKLVACPKLVRDLARFVPQA